MRDKTYYRDRIQSMQERNPFYSNTDIAYHLILQDILDGSLQPLDKVPQDILAELFDMSRTPVRDALLRLEKENFIVKSEKAGYQVHKISFKEYFEFCDFRLLIESHAAYLAANSMVEAEMEELGHVLRAFNEACDEACNEQNVDKIFELDERFHELIVKGSHNRYLYKAFLNYKSKKKFYFTLNVKGQRNITRMKNKHNKIYEAIRQNDEDEASRCMANHLKIFFNFYN